MWARLQDCDPAASQGNGGQLLHFSAPRVEWYRLLEWQAGRWEVSRVLYASDQLECMELCLGMDEKLTKSLRIRIKGRAGTGVITISVCYRKTKQISSSSDREDKPYIHKPWWCLTTLISLQGTIGQAGQQDIGNPTSSCKILMVNPFSKQ